MEKMNVSALIRDTGIIYTVGNESICLAKLHQICPSSWDHAMKHEGYSIVPIVVETGEPIEELTEETIKQLGKAFYNSYIRKTISNREKEVNKNISSVEVENHGGLIVANVYNNEGSGYQIVLNQYNLHKSGDITN